jgi:uncharacterized iron-regulated protein
MRSVVLGLALALFSCVKSAPTQKPIAVVAPPMASPSMHGGSGGLPAGKIIDAKTGQEISFEAMIASLTTANQVYVGEIHDDKLQHEAQLWVVKALFYQRPGQVAVGMEMFQRPFQSVLDLYLDGEIGEKALVRETQYEKRWGYSFGFYRPILRFALDHGVPVIALNTEAELVKKISAGGIDGLTAEEKAVVPQLDLNVTSHKERIKAAFEAHPHGGNFDKFYTIQTLWDETMADSAVKFLQSVSGKVQMVILAGHGHTDRGDGIPDRVKRRLPEDNYKIVVPITVSANEKLDLKELQAEKLGDFLWILSAPAESEDNGKPQNPHKKSSN